MYVFNVLSYCMCKSADKAEKHNFVDFKDVCPEILCLQTEMQTTAKTQGTAPWTLNGVVHPHQHRVGTSSDGKGRTVPLTSGKRSTHKNSQNLSILLQMFF